MDDGNADSGAVNGLGKPCAGEPHARFDEGRLETGHGRFGTASARKGHALKRTTTAPASYSTAFESAEVRYHRAPREIPVCARLHTVCARLCPPRTRRITARYDAGRHQDACRSWGDDDV